MSKKTTAFALSVGLTCAAASAFAQDEEGTIKYRQGVMKAVGGHTGAIAQIAKGTVPHTGHLGEHARALHELSKQVVEAFKQQTSSDETRAKPVVWEEWSEFEQKSMDMQSATEELAAAATSGDMDAFGGKLKATFDACKGCHEKFRVKKD